MCIDDLIQRLAKEKCLVYLRACLVRPHLLQHLIDSFHVNETVLMKDAVILVLEKSWFFEANQNHAVETNHPQNVFWQKFLTLYVP